MNTEQATRTGIEFLARRVEGWGGVSVVDKDGQCDAGFTTKKMINGCICPAARPRGLAIEDSRLAEGRCSR